MIPIKTWGRSLPAGAREQLKTLAAQPWVVEHVAAMPDLHVANGVAVGSVFATERTIVPAALGGDLGCGMQAIRFDFRAASLSRRELERLLSGLGAAIPVGDEVHRKKAAAPLPHAFATNALQHACERLAPRHLGTLGGGNHFVELDRDGGGDLWLLIHSGSRGVGAAIAAHHVRVGAALNVETPEGAACLADLAWAITFARANRDAIREAAVRVLGLEPMETIDVHHNFVQREVHFGRPLWIHRKGAIAAPAGSRALIPGSMGTASYVVEGLGEPTSFTSASHGAGRVMTRSQAHHAITPDKLRHSLRRVVFDQTRLHALVEEAPAAYRDLGEVLEDEKDLVVPRIRLEPIASLKG